jgi:ATP-dependent DNA helicase RecG
MGTGTGDMIRRCREIGLAEPQFSVSDGFVATIWRHAGQVTGQVTEQAEPWLVRVFKACELTPQKSADLQAIAGIRHRETFQRNYLDPLLNEGMLERIIPDKPKSRLQQYRLSAKGIAKLATLTQEK